MGQYVSTKWPCQISRKKHNMMDDSEWEKRRKCYERVIINNNVTPLKLMIHFCVLWVISQWEMVLHSWEKHCCSEEGNKWAKGRQKDTCHTSYFLMFPPIVIPISNSGISLNGILPACNEEWPRSTSREHMNYTDLRVQKRWCTSHRFLVHKIDVTLGQLYTIRTASSSSL